MTTRARGFKVILHDTRPDHDKSVTKGGVVEHAMALLPLQAVVALEEHGIDVYYRFPKTQPKALNAQVKYWVDYWKHGNVQCDAMLGSMLESCKYLSALPREGLWDADPSIFPPPAVPTKVIKPNPEENFVKWLLTPRVEYDSAFKAGYLKSYLSLYGLPDIFDEYFENRSQWLTNAKPSHSEPREVFCYGQYLPIIAKFMSTAKGVEIEGV
jgi:hypothetical protein